VTFHAKDAILTAIGLPTHKEDVDRSRGASSDALCVFCLAGASSADLRDPFALHKTAPRPRRAGIRSFRLPDLKDPFAFRRRGHLDRWNSFPGDIRNPFSAAFKPRKTVPMAGCVPPDSVIVDGVVIQVPRARRPKKESEDRCYPPVPLDLRDPFAVSATRPRSR